MATIEKRRKDFDDWLIIEVTVTLEFHILSFTGVGHRDNVSIRTTTTVAPRKGLEMWTRLEPLVNVSLFNCTNIYLLFILPIWPPPPL
jgi:hypothetical protein